MLGLWCASLAFMHTRRLRRGTLGSMLARLPVICLCSLLLCMLLRLLLRLLNSEHLLLRKALLAMRNLLLKVHHIHLAHSRIPLHGSHLSSIQSLCAIW